MFTVLKQKNMNFRLHLKLHRKLRLSYVKIIFIKQNEDPCDNWAASFRYELWPF